MTLPRLRVFHLVGTVFTTIGLGFAWEVHPYLVSGRYVEGTVIKIEGRGQGEDSAYWPIVDYQVAGKTYRAEARVHESYPSWTVGRPATVVYLPSDPAGGRVYSFSQTYLLPGGFTAMGDLLLFAGFAKPLEVDQRPESAATSPEESARS